MCRQGADVPWDWPSASSSDVFFFLFLSLSLSPFVPSSIFREAFSQAGKHNVPVHAPSLTGFWCALYVPSRGQPAFNINCSRSFLLLVLLVAFI